MSEKEIKIEKVEIEKVHEGKMKEKEAIEVLERVIMADRFDGLFSSIGIIIEAMQSMINLYNKEKEKNKKLKKENNVLEIIHKSYKEMIEENNLISKDKNRVYEKEGLPALFEKVDIGTRIDELEKLLEEETDV